MRQQFLNIGFFLQIITTGSKLVLADVPPFNQKLVVVSFDGFRQTYFDNNRFLPWFSYFRNQGVYSDRVQSIFPSETFPNHFAIVTGLYAESHGIVSNNMYDPILNATFSKSESSPIWWAAEPIWVTAVRQNRRTAVLFWPGSVVKYPPGNFTPTFYRPVYDTSVPMEDRIDEAVQRLKRDDVDLAFIYYHQPDFDGHANGVPSSAVNDRLQQSDWYLSYLLKKLDDADLGRDKVNIILCSDHGMTNITNPIFLEDFVSKDDIDKVPSYGTVVSIHPKPGKLETVFEALNTASKNGQHFTAYRKNDVPPDLHYSNNARIMDIVVICELGTYMKFTRPPTKVIGVHGYDPKQIQMRPIFLARGPAFKKGGYRAANMFETKDIYAIIAHVTGVTPLRTNASLELVMDLFSNSAPSSFHHLNHLITAPTSFTASILVIITNKFITYH